MAKGVIEVLPVRPRTEENLRRRSLLKSAVFSARIEGNKLSVEDVLYNRVSPKEVARKEIDNINNALGWIYTDKAPKKITKNLILKLHKLTMKTISPTAGQFRTEQSAIFNQAGVAIYMPPPPTDILQLIDQFIKLANRAKPSPPIKTAVCHFAFEKIHPFLDGNGRVGRLLSTFMLKTAGYGFRSFATLEEYIDKQRQDYYALLALSQKDITPFIEFFLEAVAVQAEKVIEQLKNIREERPQDQLFPRQQEILAILKDHQMVSFNFLKPRFSKISDSTLHYDLRQLIKQGFIKKIGSTRGALYSPKVLS